MARSLVSRVFADITEPEVLAVGHGDPMTAGAAVRLRSLVEGL